MAIPTVGGGYQFNDGNPNEIKLSVAAAPATATSSATLTTTQLLNGIILGSPGTSAAAYTLPLAADLDSALGNAHVNSTFDFTIINANGSSSGAITVTTNTGWTIGSSGSQGLMVIPATAGTAFRFRARKTADGAWSLYTIG